ncbi:MAG: polysaccharide deacetylase family protein [Chitinivibrionales bacterium]|nr:polysaccharide deacetylase family protein [Chitinivibrionales bacterium]
MSSPGKRKRHRCKNHAGVTARGRCAVCGAWICKECMVLKGGQFYCRDTCDPAWSGTEKKRDRQSAETPEMPAPSPVRARRSAIDMLPLFAGVCLALGGIAFALLAVRKSRELSIENRFLKQRRADLIRTIKANNREIALLLKEVHSLKVEEEAAGERKKRNQRTRPRNVKYFKPESGLPFSLDNGDFSKKVVALTFDGGSHANAADEILDTLKNRNVKATMFVTGRFIVKHTPLIRRIVNEGHELGNHTYSHPHLTAWAQDHVHTTLPDITREVLGRELARANAVLMDRLGREFSPFWRAPYGERNRQICRWALTHGYLHVGWRQGRTWYQNLDSNDWVPDEDTPGYHSPQEVFEKVMAMAQSEPYGINGGIILMHLGTVRREREERVHIILGKLIDELRLMGYRLVTVSGMLKESGTDIERVLAFGNIAGE